MKIDKLPILGICGFSGSGKTTLIEALLIRLKDKGLRVAVAKHSSQSLQLDAPGKDSERFFQAGAHVYLRTKQESFVRTGNGIDTGFSYDLLELARCHDLVLVEGHKDSQIPKVWLLSEGETAPPSGCQEIIAVLKRDQGRVDYVADLIESWLPERWGLTPVYGCILIGGKSSRMGQPKHLIRQGDKTWLEHTLDKLHPLTDKVVVAGRGALPETCSIDRLIDPPQLQGPLAGMVAAFRWAPWASWLVTACDMPDLQLDAVKWLLEQRAPGKWAIIPSLQKNRFEPLLAYYDFRIHKAFEELPTRNIYKPAMIGSHEKTVGPTPPAELQKSWRNVNLPGEI